MLGLAYEPAPQYIKATRSSWTAQGPDPAKLTIQPDIFHPILKLDHTLPRSRGLWNPSKGNAIPLSRSSGLITPPIHRPLDPCRKRRTDGVRCFILLLRVAAFLVPTHRIDGVFAYPDDVADLHRYIGSLWAQGEHTSLSFVPITPRPRSFSLLPPTQNEDFQPSLLTRCPRRSAGRSGQGRALAPSTSQPPASWRRQSRCEPSHPPCSSHYRG